ncbi:MAG: OmpA family protein [Sandaracinaceae bacterium]|nr:OmpA family protein [Sandaracinaceae bacterium]
MSRSRAPRSHLSALVSGASIASVPLALLALPAIAQAESGRYDVHLGVGDGALLDVSPVGIVGHVAFDWQLAQPVAIEAMVSGGAFVGTQDVLVGYVQAGVGARIRVLDDDTGYALDGGSIHGGLSIAPHVGVGVAGSVVAFTLDTEIAYDLSVAEPVSLGVFVRPTLAVNDQGVPNFALFFGVDAQIEIEPLWTRDVDTDGDGVLDRRDRCPATPPGTTVDRRGCVPLPPVIVLEGITFAFDSATIEASSEDELRHAIDTLAERPELRVEIAGHTDDQGQADYNLRLSRERAQAVADYFVAHGIERGRLVVRGYGSERPRADGTDESSRARNRRIELHTLETAD